MSTDPDRLHVAYVDAHFSMNPGQALMSGGPLGDAVRALMADRHDESRPHSGRPAGVNVTFLPGGEYGSLPPANGLLDHAGMFGQDYPKPTGASFGDVYSTTPESPLDALSRRVARIEAKVDAILDEQQRRSVLDDYERLTREWDRRHR